MTQREQHIAAIRAACIKANPEIVDYDRGFSVEGGWKYDWIDGHGVVNRSRTFQTREEAKQASITEGNRPSRPIRLADVLCATAAGNRTPGRIGTVFEEDVRVLGGIAALWNLRTDDIEQQSDETIAFIHALL